MLGKGKQFLFSLMFNLKNCSRGLLEQSITPIHAYIDICENCIWTTKFEGLKAQGIKCDNYTKTNKIIYIHVHVRNNPGNLKIKIKIPQGASGRPTLEFSICHFSFNCVIDAKPRGKLVTACMSCMYMLCKQNNNLQIWFIAYY